MSRWPMEPVLDACHLIGTRVGAFTGVRQYVSTGDVDATNIVSSQPVTFDDLPARADLVAEEGDALFARMQATDKVVSVTAETRSHIWSTGFAALRPKQGTDRQWFRYWLMSPAFQRQKDALCTGATQKAINNDAIRELSIPLPPLPEQERMVRILDDADSLRRLRERANGRTDELIASCYSNLFRDAGAGRTWQIQSVEDLAKKYDGSIRTGPFGSQLLHSEFIDNGVPVLGIDNVVENEFRWTKPRCLPPEKFEKFRRFQVFPGDVLITIMGTVGKCCVAPDRLPTCMSTKHLCVVTPDREKVHPWFLWAALVFDPEVRHQAKTAGGGAVMEGWNSTIIKQLRLRVPPIAVQHIFAARVAEIRRIETTQAESRKRVEDLFQSLLHRAFQGEL